VTNPLFNSNTLKLGIFGANVSGGCAITSAEEAYELTWPNTQAIARLADGAGLEALVPVGRWKGAGGVTNFNGASFESYTWATGIGAQTSHIAVLATSHVSTVHPVVAAKLMTTVDHVTNGRFGVNVVCGGGFFTREAPMFGAPRLEHDLAYEYAAEWLDVCRRLWTSDAEFDYDGRFFQLRGLFHEPKPIQQPYPAIMNAGTSAVGQRFAAREADLVFVPLVKGHVKEHVESHRASAREFGREIQVWSNAYVVCRPTEKEARDYVNYYVLEKGDWEAANNIMAGGGPSRSRAATDELKFRLVAGWYGYPLVGTPEQIVSELEELSRCGLDGCLLSWVNYEAELRQWIVEVMPLLEQAGLRNRWAGNEAASLQG
jgi:alkanesulfonate monooxygenase SsuD/methylene tetrahydromethanopterin reductase-like flavin-dependent oxidoreductase (luciferase family)